MPNHELSEAELEALAYYTQVCHGLFFVSMENRNGYKDVLRAVNSMGWDTKAFTEEVMTASKNGLVITAEYQPKRASDVQASAAT